MAFCIRFESKLHCQLGEHSDRRCGMLNGDEKLWDWMKETRREGGLEGDRWRGHRVCRWAYEKRSHEAGGSKRK